MRHYIAFVALSIAMTLASRAAAQPGNTPATAPPAYTEPSPPPLSLPGEVSPGLATALSLGGTAVSIGALAIASSEDNDALGAAGALGLLVAPSVGHWYAGKAWTTGLTLRLAGTGAAVVGSVMAFACFTGDGDCEEGPIVVLVYGGMGAFVAGSVYDIATASRSARTHNARLRARVDASWAVAPVVTPGQAGLAISGRF